MNTYPQHPPAQPIPDYMAWAVISTVFAVMCCCPIGLVGIVAIVYASQVNTLVQHGHYSAAQRASDNAKIWCWITTIFAILGIPLTIFMMLIGVAGG